MSRPVIGSSARLGAVALAAGVGLAVSYVAQRLFAAFTGEPDPLDVLAQAHIPMFFRVALGAVHAAVLASLTALLPESACAAALRATPYAVPVLAVVLAALALLVP